MNVVDILPKTMISFLNMSTASAPIQNTEARVKYWIRQDMAVQAIVFSVLSTPTRKMNSIPIIAMHN